MAETDSLSRLSCARCKGRKVRCNRVQPRCERCKAQDVECFYPERVKRRTTRLVPDRSRSATGDPALATILERLQRLEKQSLGSSPSSSRQDTHVSPYAQSSSSSPAASANWNSHATPSGLSRKLITTSSGDLDPTAILKDAIDRVQKLKLQGYASSVITDSIDVPVELAKTWIRNYFIHAPSDMFLSLVNKKLIEMMPDITGLPHVQVDPSVIVVYYCILYHGLTLNASNNSGVRSIQYAKPVYLACLRSLPGWRREATGSTMDFIAALFMTRVCAEFFDFELAWQLYKRACEYAKGLDLHNLDGENYSGITNGRRSDDDRRGFWQLIQIDLYFRLLMNKPPIITGNAWKVNLPWLDANSQPPLNNIQATTFLIGSRITMILIRFFAILDDPQLQTQRDIRSETEALCHELKQLYADWQINSFMADMSEREEDLWVIGDILFTGYTSIIFMLRKMYILDSVSPEPIVKDADIPNSPIVLDASREIVNILIRVMDIYPHAQTVCALLGLYVGHVPIAILYCHVLRTLDTSSHAEDIELLRQLSSRLFAIAKADGDRDMYPLVWALQTLDGEVVKRVSEMQVR